MWIFPNAILLQWSEYNNASPVEMFMANSIIVTETITLFWFLWKIDTFPADFIFISLRYHGSQIKSAPIYYSI